MGICLKGLGQGTFHWEINYFVKTDVLHWQKAVETQHTPAVKVTFAHSVRLILDVAQLCIIVVGIGSGSDLTGLRFIV